MAYIPDPTDPTRPIDTDPAGTADEEFRALKAYLSALVAGAGLTAGFNPYRKNVIIGGDFSLNPWQRGTSFAAIADGTYGADRWKYSKEITGAVQTLRKTADAPPVANANYFTSHCLEVEVTTADAAVGATDLILVRQTVEGYNFAPIAQRPIALSFWHKHSKIGIYCTALRNSAGDQSYVAEYTQLVANTWEYSTIPIPASPAGGTWDYTTGSGIEVSFTMMCGLNLQGVTGWQAANKLCTVNQVNGADTVGNFFRIALVQLEKGTVSTPFEQLTVQQTLQLCKRYLPSYKQVIGGTAEYLANGHCTAVNTAFFIFPFETQARSSPTGITISPVGNFRVLDAAGAPLVATALTFALGGLNSTLLQATVAAGLVAGNATMLDSTNGSNGSILFTGCEF